MSTIGDLLKVAKFIKALVEGKKSSRWELVRAYSMAMATGLPPEANSGRFGSAAANLTAAEELADELISRMQMDKEAIEEEEAFEEGEIE